MGEDAGYQVLLARDARYDGRLFFGVKTTGIFCRPVCTARKPKRENVTVFKTAAAAAEEGFRPCLRCRPETSPGTPAWDGTEVTVRRALRLIADGALDDEGIDPFAARVGVGSRHLRRLFQQHVGAPPIAVARMRRVLFAKRLIDESAMPLTQVALSAGFGSVRRFNSEIRDIYRESPTELRARKQKALPTKNRARFTGELQLELSARPPFDWKGLYEFLESRATPGVELLDNGTYKRTLFEGGSSSVMEVSERKSGPGIALTLRMKDPRGLIRIVERVRQMFDLDADPQTIANHLRRDRTLRPLIDASPGRRVPGAWDPFELAVRAVLGQQVTVKGATTLTGRIAERFGAPLGTGAEDRLDRLFPTPQALATADLSDVGLPKSRQETLRSLAQAFVDGTLPGAPDSLDETIQRWTEVPGIGPWTAHYVAMRAFGEPDGFPDSDLGLRKAMHCEASATPAQGEESPSRSSSAEREARSPVKATTAAALRHRAEAWRPWRAYAAMHLWSSL